LAQIVEAGSINTTAQITPDVLVQILPPANQLINGVPTNVVGMVGTASWGPVGVPTPVSAYADYVRQFGALVNRVYDMGTAAAAAILQGANNLLCVRVSDGTDVAATLVVQTSCITFTSKWTGTAGNGITVVLSNGSAASSFRATVSMAGIGTRPEVFDNLTGSGNALWIAMAAAINNGQSGIRGPSQIITATAGVGTTAPTLATLTLAAGTDGVTTISGTVLLGSDAVPRKGMYALRGTPASIGCLVDNTDSTTWATQIAFGLAEGVYMIVAGVAGQTAAAAATAKASAGIDTRCCKVMLGDHILFQDTANGLLRLVNPASFMAGKLGNLSPEQSSLNKPIYGVVGTQRSQGGAPYSQSELDILGNAGIDLICNPVPGGSYFGGRFGRNSSSNPVTRGDNHTRMTNYIAKTIATGMGLFVGKLNSDTLRRQARATLDAFFRALFDQGMIESWSVQCDETNNPPDRRALGYLQIDIKVRYLSIVEFLIANLEGGQSVQITRLPLAA
jgi:phage tail sheath protein FI